MKKTSIWVSDTNRAVQSRKRARSLNFRILEEEELYYPSRKNKAAVIAQLTCAFAFAYADCWFSNAAALLIQT